MPAPLSLDLRKRLIEAYEAGEGSIVVVSERFQVGSATMKRLLWRKRDTGDVAPKKRAAGFNTKLDDNARVQLAAWVHAEPDLTREELATKLVEARGIRVSVVTIGRELKRLGLSRKKKSFVACEQDNARILELRARHAAWASTVNLDRLVFLDESGVTIAMARTYGWAPIGQRVSDRVPRNRG